MRVFDISTSPQTVLESEMFGIQVRERWREGVSGGRGGRE